MQLKIIKKVQNIHVTFLMNNETLMLILRVNDKKKASGSFLYDKVFHYAGCVAIEQEKWEKMKKTHKNHIIKRLKITFSGSFPDF